MELGKICNSCFSEKGDAESCPVCGYINGTQPQSPQQLTPGTILNGRYLIGRVIGHGGFGITYLALDMNLNVKLAIKEYLPHDLATRYMGNSDITVFTGQSNDSFQYGMTKYLDEARMLAALGSQPGIVGIHNYFQENGTAYIVMEYLDGITLKGYIEASGGKIPVSLALEIIQHVMGTLNVVHEKGMLHRDVSPDNIFITKSGQVKLLDFGASRYAMSEQNNSMSILLKPGFAPVEQYYSKGKQGAWTDVYATAATFYRAVTGVNLPESMERMSEDNLKAPSELGITISQGAEKALMKALSVKFSDRYQTMKDFQNALFEGEEGNADSAAQPSAQPVAGTVIAAAGQPNDQPIPEIPVNDTQLNPQISPTVAMPSQNSSQPVNETVALPSQPVSEQGTGVSPVVMQAVPAGPSASADSGKNGFAQWIKKNKAAAIAIAAGIVVVLSGSICTAAVLINRNIAAAEAQRLSAAQLRVTSQASVVSEVSSVQSSQPVSSKAASKAVSAAASKAPAAAAPKTSSKKVATGSKLTLNPSSKASKDLSSGKKVTKSTTTPKPPVPSTKTNTQMSKSTMLSLYTQACNRNWALSDLDFTITQTCDVFVTSNEAIEDKTTYMVKHNVRNNMANCLINLSETDINGKLGSLCYYYDGSMLYGQKNGTTMDPVSYSKDPFYVIFSQVPVDYGCNQISVNRVVDAGSYYIFDFNIANNQNYSLVQSMYGAFSNLFNINKSSSSVKKINIVTEVSKSGYVLSHYETVNTNMCYIRNTDKSTVYYNSVYSIGSVYHNPGSSVTVSRPGYAY